MDDMNGHNFIRLSQYGKDLNNVVWSEDNRVAITTPDTIFVATLKSTGSVDVSGKPPKGRPPLNITTASNSSLKVVDTCSDQASGNETNDQQTEDESEVTMMDSLDLLLVKGPHVLDYFKESNWSPVDGNKYGGSLLTTLTYGGRISVFNPPSLNWKSWNKVAYTIRCSDTSADVESHTTDTPVPSGCAPSVLFGVYTTFAWYPLTMNKEDSAVLAVGTRSGHLLILEVDMPVIDKVSSKTITLALLPDCGKGEVWISRLLWSTTDHGTVSLAVGCTDGRVYDVSWGIHSLLTGDQLAHPEFKLLCKANYQPIQHLAWQRGDYTATSDKVLVFDNGSSLMVVNVNDGDENSRKLRVCGHHSLPISGLKTLENKSFVSTSLDGTMQIFTLPYTIPPPSGAPDSDYYVTPVPIKTGVSMRGPISILGMAISINGMLAAFSVNQSMNQEKKQSSSLYFLKLPILPGRSVTGIYYVWDCAECIRQYYLQNEIPSPALMSILENPAIMNSRLSLQIDLQDAVIAKKRQSVITKAKENIILHFLSELLHDWVGVFNLSNDKDSELTAKLMVTWLQFCDEEDELVESALKVFANQDKPSQPCPSCKEEVWLSDPITYTCANGHSWDLCPLSLRLIERAGSSRCMQCDCSYNTPKSLNLEDKTWLYCQLIAHVECFYCGGYFENES